MIRRWIRSSILKCIICTTFLHNHFPRISAVPCCRTYFLSLAIRLSAAATPRAPPSSYVLVLCAIIQSPIDGLRTPASSMYNLRRCRRSSSAMRSFFSCSRSNDSRLSACLYSGFRVGMQLRNHWTRISRIRLSIIPVINLSNRRLGFSLEKRPTSFTTNQWF